MNVEDPFATATESAEPLEEGFPLPRRRAHTEWLREYFIGDDPTFRVAVVSLCLLAIVLYTRHPSTNFIFDEQEALLANPYVRSISDSNSKLGWFDAFRRDFWGLTPDRTIGSYRPIPDMLWRVLWPLANLTQRPLFHHWMNVLLHGANGALLTVLAFKLVKNRVAAWLIGTTFVATAVVTEAVSGVVGIADVLGGLSALLGLLALFLPAWAMPFGVLGALLLGLFSKESALCLVPLIPFAALMLSQVTHPKRPYRWGRAALAGMATLAAFIFYVEFRRRAFPAAIPAELSVEVNLHKPWAHRTFAGLLRWYAQPSLPRDPLNNPLIDASPAYRIAGSLRVYARGLGQVLFPWRLSGDYSAPQEPIPSRLVFAESVIGAVTMIGPLIVAPLLGFLAWLRFRRDEKNRLEAEHGPGMETVLLPGKRNDLRPLVGLAMMWIVISYFPVSNIPVLLPTVRAERFWYFPAIGTSILLGLVFWKFLNFMKTRQLGSLAVALIAIFLTGQGIFARLHANDYKDDLAFWDATRQAVPRSAKAHLNYSVMLGAGRAGVRQSNLQGRLDANKVALDLAPKWPMASVYYGDTLCRMQRAREAVPYYARGFDLAPNDLNLIALGLHCLWENGIFREPSAERDQLQALADKYPGSWLKYLWEDTLTNGEENKGVNAKYRPRGYNDGPKKED